MEREREREGGNCRSDPMKSDVRTCCGQRGPLFDRRVASGVQPEWPQQGARAGWGLALARGLGSWDRNREMPVEHQRPTSSSTESIENSAKHCLSEPKTLVMIERRFAPRSVLLVRDAFLAWACPRACRSERLFVASTSGCSTNTNRLSRQLSSSFCSLRNRCWSSGISFQTIRSVRVQRRRMRS
jgi:hypothetical protein